MIYLKFKYSYQFISVCSKICFSEILNGIESEWNNDIIMKMNFLGFHTIHYKGSSEETNILFRNKEKNGLSCNIYLFNTTTNDRLSSKEETENMRLPVNYHNTIERICSPTDDFHMVSV